MVHSLHLSVRRREDALGVSRDLARLAAAFRDNVVPAGEGSRDTQTGKRLDDRLCEIPEIEPALAYPARQLAASRGDEREIDVSEIMEDRPAAGQTPHDPYPARPRELKIYLRERVLVPADYDRGGISPEHEYVVVRMLEQIFLGREVEVRVGALVYINLH